MFSLDRYREVRQALLDGGFEAEIAWAQSVPPVSNALSFWREFAFVVLNSGMRAQVASGIWERVQPVVEAGGSASEVFGHKGKAQAIDLVWRNREALLADYLQAQDKLAFIRAMPWIGPITCWHLAKNYGLDVAKPDRHLVRIAGAEGVAEMCARLSAGSGDRVAAVDMVLWRAANLGLLDTRAMAGVDAGADA